MKQIILFKNASLLVHRTAEEGGNSAENLKTVLESKHLAIPLSAAAAEVLVGYLQVMRAYLATSNSTKQQVRFTFEKVAIHLEQQLKLCGRTKAKCADVTDLIQQMGCLHDWASKRAALPEKFKIRD